MGNFILRKKSRFSFFKKISHDLLGFYLYKKKLKNFRLFNFFFSNYGFKHRALMYNDRVYFNHIKGLFNTFKYRYKVSRFKFLVYRNMYIVRANYFHYKFNFHSKFRKNDSDFFKKLILLKKFRLFLGNMPMKQLLSYYYSSLKDRYNSLSTFLVSIERRLDVFIFRLQLFKSFNDAKKAIINGYIFVNNVKITCYNFAIKENDIISFRSDIGLLLRKNFLKNIKSGKIFLNIPSYIYFDFRIMKGVILFDLISLNNIFYPSRDFYDVRDYFKIN